jgi:hypothetical protein
MQPLRIVTTGLAVSYPFGGVFWDYVQYPLGLSQLGHDVLYLEDTGRWCYAPQAGTFVAGGKPNAAAFARHLEAHAPELAERWFFRDATGATYGRPWEEVVRFCGKADLFLNISAACWLRDEHRVGGRCVLIDSDPLYTQTALLTGSPEEVRARLDWWARRYQAFFTFAENIGDPSCAIPTGPFRWIPTRQPVVLDRFAAGALPVDSRRRVLTTVASWEPAEKGPVFGGVAYHGKSVEWERFIELPSRSVLPLEVALSGPAPIARLRTQGWHVRDALEVSADPAAYRSYLACSAGEWSVAKNAYVASGSGWFSCRTACYLALGVPAVVQDTGFSRVIPAREGVLPFTTLDQAAAAIGQLADEPERHADAALGIAAEYFDSARVLTRLLEQALS